MSHPPGPITPPDAADVHDDDRPALIAANARSGLWLFGLYLALYGGFVALSAFAPRLMAWRALAGLNVAVLYGMGLIAAAVILSLVYMVLCGRNVGRHGSRSGSGSGGGVR